MADFTAEKILAAASGSADGVGKVGTIANAAELIVRCDASAHPYQKVLWRIKADQVHDLRFFKSRTVVPTATITLAAAARVDDTDTFALNGLTYTAESTSTDAAYASRKWGCGTATYVTDAAALAALINADYAVVPDGSVVVGDTLVVVTVDDLGVTNTYTYTAAAAASYTTRTFDQSGNQAAELASIVLALNHGRNVTCASVAAADTVTVQTATARLTFTAHATTTTVASRQFSISGTNSQDGDELVTCLNDATYGLGPGYTATNAAGVVTIRTNGAAYPQPVITSSNGTRLACVNIAGGVPGIAALATGATGELSVTPTWVKSVTITGGTHITATNIDCPGVYAAASSGVVTLTPGTPGSPSNGLKASVLQFAQGTSDAGEVAWSDNSVAVLIADDIITPPVSGAASNSTTTGVLYEQYVDGYQHAYVGITNKSGAAALTPIVGATLAQSDSVTSGVVTVQGVASMTPVQVTPVPLTLPEETVVAGANSTLGKIGTIANAAVIYVRCPASAANYSKIMWRISADKTHDVQLYRARDTVRNTVTMTLADVDNGDTVVINGLTFTGHTNTTTPASRQFSIAGTDVQDATEFVSVLNDATYGVPGVTASNVGGTSATITLTATTATTIQAVLGTAGAGEIAITDTTLINLTMDGSSSTGRTANNTTAGIFFEQYLDGYPDGWLGITNKSGGDAATVVIGATLVP
jgi:hypothetical protein